MVEQFRMMQILAQNPNLKIIMASADDAIREEAAKIGVIEFLEKLFSMQNLTQIMKKYTILTVQQDR